MKQENKYGNYLLQLTPIAHRLKIQSRVKLFYRLTWCLALVLSLIIPSLASAELDREREHERVLSSPSPDTVRLQDPDIVNPSATLPWTVLISIGDSLTHGTMDATNNYFNSWHAYLQKVSNSIAQVIPLAMKQPFFDLQENRIFPFDIPTNLGVDGSDMFSIEGIEYHKRVGADAPFVSPDLLCDAASPEFFSGKYDKVLFPINLEAGQPVSPLDAGIWLINETLPSFDLHEAFIIFWSGNNDSSLAALGAGGKNPEYQPIPFDVIGSELNPILSLLLAFAEISGQVSFEPYTQSAIERNLTELNHFFFQYLHVLDRLINETASSGVNTELFLLTLPYYSAIGYLFDSEDLEFYLRKVNPGYSVPATFGRVAPAGQPITDPLKGDRISLLTFGMMYALLSTGHSVDDVNQALEIDGQQRDGLVLSEEEQQFIMSRIDGFNEAIKTAASFFGPNVHVIDIGQFLNNTLTGQIPIIVNDLVFSRKWIRGGGFSFDGVHPSYTGHALVADYVLYHINNILGLNAPLYNLSDIMMNDPYIDQDGDGWASGPGYEGEGITRLLFLLKDPDDSNPDVQVEMPPDVWDIISDVLMSQVLDIPAVQAEAERLGITPLE
jgi:hypothetical protein